VEEKKKNKGKERDKRLRDGEGINKRQKERSPILGIEPRAARFNIIESERC
jgi:hypothetical protein